MSEVIEIYSVRGDENIRDGEMECSYDITCRDDAVADALARCRRDPSIRKVAYYRVFWDGGFRVLFTYDNPDVQAKPASRVRRQMADPLPRMRGKPPAPKARRPGLVARLLDALKE